MSGTDGRFVETRPEPWPSSGYRSLDTDADGWLIPGPDFLRYLLKLPELAPVPASCGNEVALHARLLESPLDAGEEGKIDRIVDADTRENYHHFLAFRGLLLAAGTIEGAYLRLVDPQSALEFPPFFVRLLAQLAVRRILEHFDDALSWRTAELFFRPQKVSVDSGVLVADATVLERRRAPGGITMLQLLIREAQGAPPGPADDLEVLSAESSERYWSRSERHDMALDLSPGHEGSLALCRLLEAWVYHFHRLSGSIEILKAIDGDWRWHIGLDATSNEMLNTLYTGGELDASARPRILGLFGMTLREDHHLLERVRGHPIYLGLAMDEQQRLELKPQNLLVNLPLAESE